MDKEEGKLSWCYALETWIKNKEDMQLCKNCDLCEKRMQQHKEVEKMIFGEGKRTYTKECRIKNIKKAKPNKIDIDGME